jgi:hypothetical protein
MAFEHAHVQLWCCLSGPARQRGHAAAAVRLIFLSFLFQSEGAHARVCVCADVRLTRTTKCVTVPASSSRCSSRSRPHSCPSLCSTVCFCHYLFKSSRPLSAAVSVFSFPAGLFACLSLSPSPALPFSASNLERALSDYLAGPAAAPFDIASVPLEKAAPRAHLPVVEGECDVSSPSEVGGKGFVRF